MRRLKLTWLDCRLLARTCLQCGVLASANQHIPLRVHSRTNTNTNTNTNSKPLATCHIQSFWGSTLVCHCKLPYALFAPQYDGDFSG